MRQREEISQNETSEFSSTMLTMEYCFDLDRRCSTDSLMLTYASRQLVDLW